MATMAVIDFMKSRIIFSLKISLAINTNRAAKEPAKLSSGNVLTAPAAFNLPCGEILQQGGLFLRRETV
jgi:hypothetical protein